MKPADIGKAYDQITHRWTSDGFNLENGMAQHKKALSFVKHKGKALDIGCGCTGRFTQLLKTEGFEPTGLDVSIEMLKIAKSQQPDIEFIHADICRFSLNEQYSFITAWDSIWHIPLAEQTQVLTNIVNGLCSGGIFIFSFGGTVEAGSHTNSVMGPKVYYSSLGTNGFLSLFLSLGCEIRHLEFDQYPEVHTYLIIEKA